MTQYYCLTSIRVIYRAISSKDKNTLWYIQWKINERLISISSFFFESKPSFLFHSIVAIMKCESFFCLHPLKWYVCIWPKRPRGDNKKVFIFISLIILSVIQNVETDGNALANQRLYIVLLSSNYGTSN